MEQLLNLLWLFIALALVAAWLWQRRRVQRDPFQARLIWQIMAMSLVLLFLLFAVSITDDLHWTELATEASEASPKILKSIASRGLAIAPGVYVAAKLLAVALGIAALKVSVIDRVFSVGSPAAGFSREFSGRSPPSLS
jgi:hypothetical protein